MPVFGKRSARQKEIRRSKAERGLTWYHRALRRVRVRPVVFLVASAIATAALATLGEGPVPYREGEQTPRAIASRVAFRVEDANLTQVMRMRARAGAPDYYMLDKSLLDYLRGRLVNALGVARELAAEPARLTEEARKAGIVLDESGAEALVRLAQAENTAAYQHAVERAVQALRRQPLVQVAEEVRRSGPAAVLVDPEQVLEPLPISSDRLLYANNREHVGRAAETAAREFPSALQESMRASLVQMLRAEQQENFRPLYRYDVARTTEAQQRAEEAVPVQYVEFAEGSQLADAGRLSADEVERLSQEHREYVKQREADPRLALKHDVGVLGRGLVVFLLVLGMGGFMVRFYDPHLGAYRRRLITAVTLLLLLALARATYLYTPYVHLAFGLQAVGVALLAITAGGGPAYASGAMLAIITTLAVRESMLFAATLLVMSLVLFLGLREIRSRGRIIGIGVVAAVTAGAITQIAGFVEGQALSFVLWNNTIWAAVSTLAAAFLVEGALPGVERVFRVTTALTLLEWCDPNKPLLRMLAAESPGTYNHSLLIGTLADAAAEAIGADALLARAGAYYHDIGKINKPEYFVENQALGINRHDRLSPAMSHLIIIGHVKDGIEMAKAYGLPKPLHPFIPEHHGTSVVEYFYHAANRARKPGEPEISDEQFRYPGPRPRSKETAIVMLCDGVEGAVRAMSEPTPNRIEDTVAKIVEKRLMDGQFDECELTFRELAAIQGALVKTLSSMYHGRISYPVAEAEAAAEPARHAS
ncbi:MAG: HDIG domain-containing metalloprotein [Planctomycetota bacterium]